MKDILERVNHNDGITIPEGYLEEFAVSMASMLPKREWEEQDTRVMPVTFWQKIRPYVYLAAMFMGVWCMMKTFDLMRPSSIHSFVDGNPIMTAAINNETFFNDYIINEGEVQEFELMDDLYEAGYTPDVYSVDDEPDFPIVDI